MQSPIAHDVLDTALRRCGSTWDAAQTHGLLTGRLAIGGADSGVGWLDQVLEGAAPDDVLRDECEAMLGQLFETTYRQLAERQSGFEPLLPDDEDSTAVRAEALGHWCEGFLHGLVAGTHNNALRQRLADEPLADIIRDMAQITRAAVEEGGDPETDEEAYAELVEYLRVATQLAYEELSDFRHTTAVGDDGVAPEVIH